MQNSSARGQLGRVQPIPDSILERYHQWSSEPVWIPPRGCLDSVIWVLRNCLVKRFPTVLDSAPVSHLFWPLGSPQTCQTGYQDGVAVLWETRVILLIHLDRNTRIQFCPGCLVPRSIPCIQGYRGDQRLTPPRTRERGASPSWLRSPRFRSGPYAPAGYPPPLGSPRPGARPSPRGRRRPAVRRRAW